MRGLQCFPILMPQSMASVSLPFNRLPALLISQVSVRAYGAQQAFRQESFKRIDHYTRIARTSWNLNRWIGIRMDILGALFISLLAYYQVYVQSVSAATTGFSLNMAFSFCMFIFYLIPIYNNFEVESNR
jgi:ABC-type transport system involved in cytochrome bd biosynthesis fused ATPase/permease subunit